jgi:hypothetical protein
MDFAQVSVNQYVLAVSRTGFNTEIRDVREDESFSNLTFGIVICLRLCQLFSAGLIVRIPYTYNTFLQIIAIGRLP